jgi:hypothetical protein
LLPPSSARLTALLEWLIAVSRPEPVGLQNFNGLAPSACRGE